MGLLHLRGSNRHDVDDYDLNDDNNNLAFENEVGQSLRHGDDVVDDENDEKRASLGSQGEYYLALGHEVGRTLRHGDAHAEEGKVATREDRSQRLQMWIVNLFGRQLSH